MFKFKEWFFTEGAVVKQALQKFGYIDDVKYKVNKFVYDALGENISEKQTEEITLWVTYWIYKIKEEEREEIAKFTGRVNDLHKERDYFNSAIADFEKDVITNNKDFIAAEINTINFKDTDLKPEDLQKLSDNWHFNLAKNSKIGAKGAIGTPVIKFENGWQWVNLDKQFCKIEGRAMGHCGNQAGRAGDNILSLRDRRNVPYLTFIVNHGELGESKGRFNDKPEPKFYPYIIKLLESPYVTRIMGGGYMSINNFNIYDLDRQTRHQLLEKKPDLIVMPNEIALGLSTKDKYSEFLAWFLDQERSDEYFNKYYADDNSPTDLKYYDQFVKIMNKSEKYHPSILASAKMMANKKLSDDDIKKLMEEAETENYIEDNSRYMMFLVRLSRQYTSIFNKLFKTIEIEARRSVIKYFVFHKIPLNPQFYDDLTDDDIEKMAQRYKELDRKLPDELIKSRQVIEAEKEHQLEQLNLKSIFVKALSKKELSKEQEKFFEINCLISLQDFKEISEYFVGIIRDTVPDENVSDEIYEKRINQEIYNMAQLLIPVFSDKVDYGKEKVYPLCLSKFLRPFITGLNLMLSSLSFNKEFYLHLYQLFAPSIYDCIKDTYTDSEIKHLNNRIFYDGFPLVWKLIDKLSKSVGKEFNIRDFINKKS